MNLVCEWMIEDLAPFLPQSRLEDIERLMHEQHCTEVSILDSLEARRLVGIITAGDIESRARIEGVDLYFLNAEQCMTLLPIAVTPESTLEECLRLMDINRISRMPVVDKWGRYSGVVLRKDIIGEVVHTP